MVMKLVLLPAALYGILHLLGWRYPARLWGTDQLHYYPLSLLACFILVAAATTAISTKAAWLQKADSVFVRLSLHFEGKPFSSRCFQGLCVLFFVALAYVFRDHSHFLGDSAKWFGILEYALRDAFDWEIVSGHHSRLHVPGFEYINIQQPLDLFLHFQVYRLGHALWNWTPADAYEWISCLAGGCYALALWKIAAFLNASTLLRLTLFAFLISLGSTQLFFGYGESYTLVILASTLYTLHGLRFLRGRTALVYPTSFLLLAAALHLMALCLFPSWVYLLWHDKGRLGEFFRRPQIYLPLLVAGSLIAFYAYVEFYRPLQLPLWEAREEGKYALLSVPHAMNLINEVLLLSPFGLIWGVVFLFSRKASAPHCRFLGWAALGSGVLIIVHDISMGGRDWDLMAFPGLFYALWGFLCLEEFDKSGQFLRQIRWAVLPLMFLHTALWIGINSNSERATDRLGNLLRYGPNQSRHYQYFTLGHYFLNIRKDDPQQAVFFFRKALGCECIPADAVETTVRYQTFLSRGLISLGAVYEDRVQDLQAMKAFQEAIQLQPDSPEAYYRLGIICSKLKQYPQAVEAYQEAVRLQPDFLEALFNLGLLFQKQGRYQEAEEVYENALLIQPESAEVYNNLGIVRHKQGHYEESIDNYRKAIQLAPDNVEFHFNLGMSYLLRGDRESVFEQYEIIRRLDPELAAEFLKRL